MSRCQHPAAGPLSGLPVGVVKPADSWAPFRPVTEPLGVGPGKWRVPQDRSFLGNISQLPSCLPVFSAAPSPRLVSCFPLAAESVLGAQGAQRLPVHPLSALGFFPSLESLSPDGEQTLGLPHRLEVSGGRLSLPHWTGRPPKGRFCLPYRRGQGWDPLPLPLLP